MTHDCAGEPLAVGERVTPVSGDQALPDAGEPDPPASAGAAT